MLFPTLVSSSCYPPHLNLHLCSSTCPLSRPILSSLTSTSFFKLFRPMLIVSFSMLLLLQFVLYSLVLHFSLMNDFDLFLSPDYKLSKGKYCYFIQFYPHRNLLDYPGKIGWMINVVMVLEYMLLFFKYVYTHSTLQVWAFSMPSIKCA